MTLPVSGPISFNAINVELGVAGTTTANINQASYRTLAGVPSGTISLSNFYGKSNRGTASITYSASAANVSLNVTSLGGYLAGNTDVTITVNSGVYIYATSTANAGLTLTGGSGTDTITIVNNGFIMGQGGYGAKGGAGSPYVASAGGPALNIGTGINVTINNTNASAYIGGGGGGGQATLYASGGGGAGGGAGGPSAGSTTDGGAGGSIGSSGGTNPASNISPGGGGGRIFPGTGGARRDSAIGFIYYPGYGGGAGGGGGSASTNKAAGYGGAGGSANGTGQLGSTGAGGGGGWGAIGGFHPGVTPPSGGKAVNLNGNSVTWVSGNTSRVYGVVS